ncbi:hypothetical protein DFH07DRAFT_782071 [Mycena maculata]|uniref:Uncharacterized protein n=1 Tax=Mycena maculata TaxID=230809 RepID=A0AAD7MRN9_9AGAR|nr:hypothetical protein DFH07DRAFT_782071 [Mycena maculata]
MPEKVTSVPNFSSPLEGKLEDSLWYRTQKEIGPPKNLVLIQGMTESEEDSVQMLIDGIVLQLPACTLHHLDGATSFGVLARIYDDLKTGLLESMVTNLSLNRGRSAVCEGVVSKDTVLEVVAVFGRSGPTGCLEGGRNEQRDDDSMSLNDSRIFCHIVVLMISLKNMYTQVRNAGYTFYDQASHSRMNQMTNEPEVPEAARPVVSEQTGVHDFSGVQKLLKISPQFCEAAPKIWWKHAYASTESTLSGITQLYNLGTAFREGTHTSQSLIRSNSQYTNRTPPTVWERAQTECSALDHGRLSQTALLRCRKSCIYVKTTQLPSARQSGNHDGFVLWQAAFFAVGNTLSTDACWIESDFDVAAFDL